MIQIANMKQYLSSIVQSYGYNNVKEFLAEYHTCKTEYCDYQSAVARWEQQAGNKAESDSLKARLQRKAQEVKDRASITGAIEVADRKIYNHIDKQDHK